MSGLVSVITTIYDKPQFLNECIESVLNQTYTNFELILLDDNSPNPKVREIMESYDDPRIIRWYSDINEIDRYKTARYATLINFGVYNFSSGDYITYLVDDDVYYPDRLQTLVEFIEANPEVDVVYHPLVNIDTEGKRGGVRGVKGILDGLSDDTRAFNYLDHNQVLHRRDVFFKVGGWDDSWNMWGGADAYFWKKITDSHTYFYPVGTNDHPLGGKRFHADNVQARIVEKRFFPEDQVPPAYRY